MSSSFGWGVNALMQGFVQRLADSIYATGTKNRSGQSRVCPGGVSSSRTGGRASIGAVLIGVTRKTASSRYWLLLSVLFFAASPDAWAAFRYMGGPYNPPSGCYVTYQGVYSNYWLSLWPVHNQYNGSTYYLTNSQNSATGVSYGWYEITASGGYHCCGSYTDLWGSCSLADEKSLGGSGNSCKVGHPCDPGNGNKYLFETDYQSEGRGILVSRSYNSQLGKDTASGFNWISNYYRGFETDGTTLVIRQSDGRGEPFTKNTSGQWVGDADTRLALVQDASGYTLTLRNGASERYNTTGNLVSETSPTGQTTAYGYDSSGRLATVTDAFGHTLAFGYDASGHVSTVTDPSGGIIRYGYDANNNLTRVDYPDSTAKLYHYEKASFPHHLTGVSFVDASGVTTRYATYDYATNGKAILTQLTQTDNGSPQEKFTLANDVPAAGQTTVTDPVGMQEVMTFSTNLGVKNLVSKVNQTDSKSLTQTFDAKNNLTCRKDEEGHVTTYTYNATSQRTGMTEGLAGDCSNPPASTTSTSVTRTTTYQYLSSTLDLPTLISSPSVYPGQSKTTTIQYTDTNHPNLPTVITQAGFTPGGASVSRSIGLSYNPAGQVTSVDGPRTDVNDVTTLSYYTCATGGACGQLQQVTNALGQVTTYDSYDANGRLLQMTDPNGLKTSYTYDARGRVKTITQTPLSGAAALWQYSYTAWGDVTQVIDPDGVVLTYGYDAAHYLRTVTDGAGNQIRYKYDLKGNRTQDYTYDPSGTLVRQIDIAYDLRNHVSSINAAGSLTQQVYDAVGNLTREVDPKNNPATTHGYDALNRLTQTIDALAGNTAVAYDVNDHVKQVTAPNSTSTQYSYDDIGNRLQEVSGDRGTTNYAYDTAGNVVSITDARGIVASYAYDALNRVTSIDYPGTAEDVSYTYDAGPNCTLGVGRLCQVVDASGTTQYGYDAFGNLVQQRKTEFGVTYTTGYSYSAANCLTGITYPDQRQVTYSRDAVGRISAVTATVNGSNQTIVSNRTYRADGRLLTQGYGNGLSESRTYDLQGRLTNQSLGSADTRVYGFDANGNLTSLQDAAQTGSYGYDALDRLIQDSITSTPTSTVNFGYDANGNRQSDGGGTYIYLSATNRLSQYYGQTVTLDAAGNTVNDGTYTYAYNNAGELQTVSQGATVGSYVYNAQRQRTQKTTASGTTVYHYDLTGHLIAKTQADGTPIRVYVWADSSPVAQISSGTPETLAYLHSDHEGTPRLATDPNQAVVWRYEGRAFGDTAPTGSVTVNLRFPGMYADQETGLYYNMARYYDPRIGRYIASDPIGLAGGLNTYLYVAANPLRFIDPWGLKLCWTLLPGMGKTYLDDSFYPLVQDFIARNAQSGSPVTFNEAFRTTEYQANLAKNPNATTPATPGMSLHEAGFAVDINWSQIPPTLKNIVVQNAGKAGLSWGGKFSRPDPVHFYLEVPGGSKNRPTYIEKAQRDYQQDASPCGSKLNECQ